MRNLTIMGVALIQLTILISACGAVKKIKEKEVVDRVKDAKERVELSDGMKLETSWLLQQLTGREGIVTTLIESDSAIVFDPSEGFSLKGGRVIYRQAEREASATNEAKLQVLDVQRDSVAAMEVQEKEERMVNVLDKEREGAKKTWYWVLIGLIVVFVCIRSGCFRRIKRV